MEWWLFGSNLQGEGHFWCTCVSVRSCARADTCEGELSLLKES